MAEPKKPAPVKAPEPPAPAKPVVLCDVNTCSKVTIKSDAGVIKTLNVAPNLKPALLLFWEDVGPKANLVKACADGWTFVSAE